MKLILYFIFLVPIFLSCKSLNKENNIKEELLEKKSMLIDSVNLKTKTITLPSSLIDYINNELQLYSIPTIKDYLDGWANFLNGDFLPFLASSDFNNNGNLDYAVILKKKEGNKVALFVFNAIENGYLESLLEEYNITEKGIETVISIETKGTWEAIDEKITVPSDGIFVNLIEESLSWVFYWDGEQYKKFLFD